MTVKRMDSVGIVVDDLGVAIDFFHELGLELEGRATIAGEWAGRVTGLDDQHVEIAMMRRPDGHSRLELPRFLTPPVVADHRNVPVNALGYLRGMFTVHDVHESLEKLRKRGARLVGEVVQYKDAFRLCYICGPEGFSSDSLKNSAEPNTTMMTKISQCQRARLAWCCIWQFGPEAVPAEISLIPFHFGPYTPGPGAAPWLAV